MIEEHAVAVIALLNAQPGLDVYDGAPDGTPEPPYVVAWVNTDREASSRLSGDSATAYIRITTHSIATTAIGARRVADKVWAALHKIRPAVAGWSTTRITHQQGIPPQPDVTIGPTVVDAVDVWTFTSDPA